MQKSEWAVAFIFFTFIYTLTSFSTLSTPVFADNHTNQTNTTGETHLECVNRACVLVNNTPGGNNTNLCAVSTDCFNQTNITVVRANRTLVINLTHLECVNQACAPVDGAGPDLCQSNAQCNLTNLTRMICVNQACMLVNVTDINGTVIDCVTSLDCQNMTNTTGGGGNGSNGSNDFLPLAPPASQEVEKPTTIAGWIYALVRNITGFFGLDF